MKATRSHLVREISEIVLFLFRRKLKEMPQFIALQDSKFNEAFIQNMKHEALGVKVRRSIAWLAPAPPRSDRA
jgi:hypothetical protein